MKNEKGKIVLIYILMILVIVLIVALTFVVLNNSPKKNLDNVSTTNSQPLDVNPYPNVNAQCKFSVSLDEYNALSMAGCKGGYTRYDVNISIDGKTLVATVIYSDKTTKKTGVFINDKKAITKIDNVTNIKMGIFDNKLFIADNSSNTNLLVYDNAGVKLYDLKAALNEAKIKDPLLNITLTENNIKNNTFTFGTNLFTFQTKTTQNNQIVDGSIYQVTYNNKKFNKPTIKG